MQDEVEHATKSPLKKILAAVAAVALVTWIRHLLDPLIGEHHPFILFIAAVFLAALAGGWQSGLLALVLGYLSADFFFLHPRHSFGLSSAKDQIGLVFYFFVGGVALVQFELIRRRAVELTLANIRLRREAEARLAAEAGIHRLANIVDSSEDAIIGKDLEHIVTDWNKGAEKLYGYPAAEAVGKNISFLIPPDKWDKWQAAVEKARRGGLVESFETVCLRRDGSKVEILLTLSPIFEGGQLAGLSTISRDLTYQKRLEGELRQAVKMEAVGQLAGGVAHDFNNLLTVINGYSEMLLDGLQSTDPGRDLLTEIHKAGKRAEKLTQQLLAYSRKQIMQPKVLDINARVADIKKMLHRMLGEDMEIVTDLDPELGRIKADPTQVEQIIMNLAANARDAMPHGGVLTIRTSNVEFDENYPVTHPGSRPGRYVKLSITDNGCGMDPATKEHIFEPFFTTKGIGKGTGLGLAMVYGIVKQSDGYIVVESEPEKGTAFGIHLPRIEAAMENEETSPASAGLPRGSETILLVEDDPMVLAFTKSLLQLGGYRVMEASGGREALRMSEGYPGEIHLLLSDVVMPGESGRQVAEQLVRSRPGMKVLYMSGYTDDAVIRRGISVEETPFLPKPFTPGSLARKVREALDREQP